MDGIRLKRTQRQRPFRCRKEVASNPEAKNLVNDIAETTGMLENAFAAESEIELSADKRDAVMAEIERTPKGEKVPFPFWRYSAVGSAVAAMLIIAVGIHYHQIDSVNSDVVDPTDLSDEAKLHDANYDHAYEDKESEEFRLLEVAASRSDQPSQRGARLDGRRNELFKGRSETAQKVAVPASSPSFAERHPVQREATRRGQPSSPGCECKKDLSVCGRGNAGLSTWIHTPGEPMCV